MNTPIEDLFALAKEAVLPVVWTRKKARQKFKDAATPERLLEVAEYVRTLEQENSKLRQERAGSAEATMCQDPECHTDFMPVYKEMVARGRQIDELQVKLKDAERVRDNWKQETLTRNDQLDLAIKQRNAAETKFKEMLEAEHRLSDAYIRIRQIAGTVNLAHGSEIWVETEKAVSCLVGRVEAAEAKLKDQDELIHSLQETVYRYSGPAPAVNLADLVPKPMTKWKAGLDPRAAEVWEACRAVMLCNIEEAKK